MDDHRPTHFTPAANAMIDSMPPVHRPIVAQIAANILLDGMMNCLRMLEARIAETERQASHRSYSMSDEERRLFDSAKAAAIDSMVQGAMDSLQVFVVSFGPVTGYLPSGFLVTTMDKSCELPADNAVKAVVAFSSLTHEEAFGFLQELRNHAGTDQQRNRQDHGV